MRAVVVVALLSCPGVVGAGAQGLLAKPTPQHAVVTAASSAAFAAPGGAVTLFADVTPLASMHIYAAGAADVTPVSLVVTPNAAIVAARPTYPKPDMVASPGAADVVPAYTKTFRIVLPVTVARGAKRGDTLRVAAAVNYQACDDRLCYPVASAPVVWTVAIR
jgi:hypothetical protein